MIEQYGRLLRVSEAARLLGVSSPTVRRLMATGRLDTFIINERGDRRVSLKSVEAFMRQTRKAEGT